MLKCGTQIRLTTNEKEELERLAAAHGRTVTEVKTVEDYFLATLQIMDNDLLAELEEIVDEISRKYD